MPYLRGDVAHAALLRERGLEEQQRREEVEEVHARRAAHHPAGTARRVAHERRQREPRVVEQPVRARAGRRICER